MTVLRTDAIFGSDIDGVISLLPWNFKQVKLTRDNEKIFYLLQKCRLSQMAYNYLIRKPNPVIRELMEDLSGMGVASVIISASNVNYREELERWLNYTGFHYFGNLILKESYLEEGIDYKKRVVPAHCDFYLDDREDIVRAINENSDGKCRAVLYTGQQKKELFRELFPVFR